MDKRLMTPKQLAAIRARADAATQGVLTIDRYNHGGGRFSLDHAKGRQLVADFYEIGDREFYAHARADIPALLDHIETLLAKVEAVREAFAEWEFVRTVRNDINSHEWLALVAAMTGLEHEQH